MYSERRLKTVRMMLCVCMIPNHLLPQPALRTVSQPVMIPNHAAPVTPPRPTYRITASNFDEFVVSRMCGVAFELLFSVHRISARVQIDFFPRIPDKNHSGVVTGVMRRTGLQY